MALELRTKRVGFSGGGGGGGGAVNSVTGNFVQNNDPSNPTINMFEDTWANWDVAKAESALPKGCWVRITDFNGAPLGATVFCEDVNLFSNYGAGGFLNADYNRIGTQISKDGAYSLVNSFTAVIPQIQMGNWYSTAILKIGDMWIWNNLSYQVTDVSADDGTNPSTNPAFTALPFQYGFGYLKNWNRIDAVFLNNQILFRYDDYSNKVCYSSLNTFPFGNANVSGNTIESNASVSALNMVNTTVETNYFGANSSVNMDESNGGNIYNNEFYDNVNIVLKLIAATHEGNTYSNDAQTYTFDSHTTYQDKELNNIYSTFDCQVDAKTNFTEDTSTLNLSMMPNYCGICKLKSEITGTVIASASTGNLTVGETITFTNGTVTYTAKVLNVYSAMQFQITQLSGVISVGFTYVGGTSGKTGTVSTLSGGYVASITNVPVAINYKLFNKDGLKNPFIITQINSASAYKIGQSSALLANLFVPSTNLVIMLIGGADEGSSNEITLRNITGTGINQIASNI